MDSKPITMRAVEPEPMPNPTTSNGYAEQYRAQSQQQLLLQQQQQNGKSYSNPIAPQTTGPNPAMAMPMRTGPEYGPYPPLQQPQYTGGSFTMTNAPRAPTSVTEVEMLKSNCHANLANYSMLTQQRQQSHPNMAMEWDSRIRAQAGTTLVELNMLQNEVRSIAKAAENHRWRRWIIGGAIATFVPFIRRFFRRGSDRDSGLSSNDTEYAFRRSKSLVSYIKEGLLGKGHFAKIAFFVCAVLFVFSNEVSIRVAKTMQKRIKKLCARLEHGELIDERDLKLLNGWRWRILLW